VTKEKRFKQVYVYLCSLGLQQGGDCVLGTEQPAWVVKRVQNVKQWDKENTNYLVPVVFLRCFSDVIKNFFYGDNFHLSVCDLVLAPTPLVEFSWNSLQKVYMKIHQLLKTNKCTNIYSVYSKTHIKTLKKLLHVSIYRSSSGSTCRSLLKLC
jgi:hypothetical protein